LSYQKIIAFDLDDVICHRTSEEGGVAKYHTCLPNEDMIKIVNECYKNGYKVVIYTARGMDTFKGRVHDVYDKLYDLTKAQLFKWNVAYDQLVMGKIPYSLIVDDKAVNSSQIKSFQDVEDNLNKYSTK